MSVVPQGDVRFPVETWGMKLGSVIDNIRYFGTFAEHRVKLEELGVNFVISKVRFDKIFPALEAFRVVHNHFLVPVDFVVPRGDARYPSETWGMKLGERVDTIRSGRTGLPNQIKLEQFVLNWRSLLGFEL